MNLQCLAGLPQTLDLKEEFYFNDQNWTCDSYSNARERSSKRKHAYRNQEQNYNCELEISNAQTSDSGCYKCSVSVPGHDSPVMSRELCFQVQSAGLSTSEIIAYALGAVLLALILVLAVTIGVYAVYKRAHRGDPEEIQPLVGNNQAGQHPQPQAGQQPQPRAGQQLQYQGGQQPQPRAGQQLQYQGGQQPHGKFSFQTCIYISHVPSLVLPSSLSLACSRDGLYTYCSAIIHSQVLMFLVAIQVPSTLGAQNEISSLVPNSLLGNSRKISCFSSTTHTNNFYVLLPHTVIGKHMQ